MMAQECWQSVTRISENTENRHFKDISQSPAPCRGDWGLGIGHSGVTFLLWSETLLARTPTCGTQSPGAGTRAISRPLCICPTTTDKAEISVQEECPGRGRGVCQKHCAVTKGSTIFQPQDAQRLTCVFS